MIAAEVVPLFQMYEAPPLAVIVAPEPLHIETDAGEIVAVGELTVRRVLTMESHPPDEISVSL